MLQASQIECVRGNRRLFSKFSFQLNARQAMRIRGENGSGKTSLLRMIAGLSPCESGDLAWRGKNIAKTSEDYRREMLYIGHANALQDDLSALENLRHLQALAGLSPSEDGLAEALDELGLNKVLHLPARLLSQGQKRKVALAGLKFAGRRVLWILDEPFAALDTLSMARVAGTVAKHVRDGGLVVFTTHQDIDLAGVVAQSVDLGTN
jgi:heme exporter protein A